MAAKSRILEASSVEREIGERAKAAKLKLRFDKVVLRLTADLKATLAGILPAGRSVVITVTAPIKHPAKTCETLENIVRKGVARDEIRKTIHGNEVRIRSVTRVAATMPEVLAFVHNPESDAGAIFAIAESCLLRRD